MKNKKTTIFIQAVLIIAMAISWQLYFKVYGESDTIDIAVFPATIGSWTSEDLPIPPEDQDILETKNAFVRRYTNTADGAQVYLYLVYSQHNRKVAHPPEICYLGSGISIVQNVHDPIQVEYKNLTIPTNRLTLLRASLKHVSFYWFKVGDTFTDHYLEQQIRAAVNALMGRTIGSALVRVSADVVGDDQDKAIKDIKKFSNLITPELFHYLP